METAVAPASAPVRTSRRLAAVGAAAVASLVVSAIVLAVAGAAGVSMIAPEGSEPVGLVPVLTATLMGFAAGTLVLWAVSTWRPSLVPPLAWLGLAVGVLSAAAPLVMAADLPTGLVLGLMHVVPGVAWFVALTRVPREAA